MSNIDESQQELKAKSLLDNEYINANISFNESLKQPGRAKKTKKVWKLAVFFILLFAIGAFGGSYLHNFLNSGQSIIDTEWGQIALDVPQAEERVNILAIGFDKGGYRTDTMIIISYNPKIGSVDMVSIPRDTMVGIKGHRVKLNSVFASGKFEYTVNAIRQLTSMPIHYYIAVDTEGFKSVVDALGGVDFDVPQNMKYSDPTQGLNINLQKGFQHLDGDKAEQLVRYRKYATADLQRENVQKDFIKALIEQKVTVGNLSNPSKIKNLYDSLCQHVKTNIGFDDILKYSVSVLKINKDNFTTYTLPGEPRTIGGVSYFIYKSTESAELCRQIMGTNYQPKTDYKQVIQTYDLQSLKSGFTSGNSSSELNKSEQSAVQSESKQTIDKSTSTDKTSTADKNAPQNSTKNSTGKTSASDSGASKTDNLETETENKATSQEETRQNTDLIVPEYELDDDYQFNDAANNSANQNKGTQETLKEDVYMQ